MGQATRGRQALLRHFIESGVITAAGLKAKLSEAGHNPNHGTLSNDLKAIGAKWRRFGGRNGRVEWHLCTWDNKCPYCSLESKWITKN